MGFWNKLGKIALTAAPYVAAPFTGGASMAFAPMANQGVGAWSANDAQKNAAKGLGPSKFDKAIGIGGSIAGMAGGAGAFDKLGGGGMSQYGGGGKYDQGPVTRGSNLPSTSFPTGAYKPGGWQDTLGKIGSNISGGGKPSGIVSTKKEGVDWADIIGKVAAAGAGAYGAYKIKKSIDEGGKKGTEEERGIGPTPGPDLRKPNLAVSLRAGKKEAIRNQPFRGGYDVNTLLDEDEEGNPITSTSQMPSISSRYDYTRATTPRKSMTTQEKRRASAR